MFEILDVKRANYYKWLKHSKSERDLKNEELADLVRKYDEKFNHTLGYRMMTDRINRDENKNYNDKQVYKVMKILGIKSIIRPKRRSCTVSGALLRMQRASPQSSCRHGFLHSYS